MTSVISSHSVRTLINNIYMHIYINLAAVLGCGSAQPPGVLDGVARYGAWGENGDGKMRGRSRAAIQAF